MEQNETKTRNYRKTRVGIVVSDAMDKTRVVAIQNKLQSDNSIVYCELAKQNQQFVEEIEAAADDETLKEIYSRIIETGYISAKVEPQEINSAAEDFNNLDIDDKNDY